MKRTTFAAIGFAGAIGLAGVANAADPAQSIAAVSPVVTAAASNVAAVVEAFGGFEFHKEGDLEAECEGCHSKGLGFGGEGRAAWMLSPTVSMQLNVWAEHWSGQTRFDGQCDGDCDTWSGNRQGVGTHLTFNSGGFQMGGFASLGTRDGGYFCCGFTFANAGIEAVYNASQFRMYGQAGHTIGIGPAGFRQFWADQGIRQFYARLVGTYYPQANIALSANVGMEMLTSTGSLRGRLLTWGARAEFQPSGAPIYFFGSYQGGHSVDESDFFHIGHVVRLGFGINVGNPDIQSRDRAVGLADYNCTFGVQTAPTCFEVPRP